MSTLLKWLGGIWGGIGLLVIFNLRWDQFESSHEVALSVTTSLLVFTALMVIPGLIMFAVGHGLKHKAALVPTTAASRSPIAERLKQLEALHQQGLVGDAECMTRREAILREI